MTIISTTIVISVIIIIVTIVDTVTIATIHIYSCCRWQRLCLEAWHS